ncbi:hypothetical protein F8O01_03550 [Pseudoclavibacter chungangensis]|uniref:Large exoprotein n=1 Tax=Pseudoclavibacter chungangensis TaxID=587635 RepID=A0A7J5C0W7_9MICO|nr:hypothetical protein [Pseudoclavibacter chungangensis]KAB1660408.1 hypothetical protein F8O01_03550 [Pseudoclavibacter chungangensis]NYJ65774.1 hypothetical protein [Pseudoclavibacter chungangensis]
MEFGGASSIVLLLAVGLWTAYFVPSWVRRRNYLATERNAVRLQQALRALAETAEVPDAIRVTTSGRDVAEQRRKLKRARSAAEQAERARVVAAERSLPVVPAPRNESDRARQAKATRRGRLVSTTVLVAGAIVAGVGVQIGLTVGTWWPTVGGTIAVLAGLAALQRLARVANAQRLAAERQVASASTSSRRAAAAPSPTAVTEPIDLEPVASATPVASPSVSQPGWVPVSVPRPLYLGRSNVDDDATEPGPDGGPGGGVKDESFGPSQLEALRAAARASEQAIRDAHRQDGVITFGTPRVARASDAPRASVDQVDTMPIERAAAAGATVIEPIAVPEGALVSRSDARSAWARMGVVAEEDLEAQASFIGRRRAG